MLLPPISRRNRCYPVWQAFLDERYVLCISNDIIEEYEEILSSHISPIVANIVISTILRANNVVRVDAQFRFGLIVSDVDDNKFVDCAIAANADYIVTEDGHFSVLKEIPFPKVEVKRLQSFLDDLL